MKIYIQRKANYKNNEIVSEKLELNEEILSFWLLNRLKVPHFNNAQEVKNFITAINLLIESIFAPESNAMEKQVKTVETPWEAIIICVSASGQESI